MLIVALYGTAVQAGGAELLNGTSGWPAGGRASAQAGRHHSEAQQAASKPVTSGGTDPDPPPSPLAAAAGGGSGSDIRSWDPLGDPIVEFPRPHQNSWAATPTAATAATAAAAAPLGTTDPAAMFGRLPPQHTQHTQRTGGLHTMPTYVPRGGQLGAAAASWVAARQEQGGAARQEQEARVLLRTLSDSGRDAPSSPSEVQSTADPLPRSASVARRELQHLQQQRLQQQRLQQQQLQQAQVQIHDTLLDENQGQARRFQDSDEDECEGEADDDDLEPYLLDSYESLTADRTHPAHHAVPAPAHMAAPSSPPAAPWGRDPAPAHTLPVAVRRRRPSQVDAPAVRRDPPVGAAVAAAAAADVSPPASPSADMAAGGRMGWAALAAARDPVKPAPAPEANAGASSSDPGVAFTRTPVTAAASAQGGGHAAPTPPPLPIPIPIPLPTPTPLPSQDAQADPRSSHGFGCLSQQAWHPYASYMPAPPAPDPDPEQPAPDPDPEQTALDLDLEEVRGLQQLLMGLSCEPAPPHTAPPALPPPCPPCPPCPTPPCDPGPQAAPSTIPASSPPATATATALPNTTSSQPSSGLPLPLPLPLPSPLPVPLPWGGSGATTTVDRCTAPPQQLLPPDHESPAVAVAAQGGHGTAAATVAAAAPTVQLPTRGRCRVEFSKQAVAAPPPHAGSQQQQQQQLRRHMLGAPNDAVLSWTKDAAGPYGVSDPSNPAAWRGAWCSPPFRVFIAMGGNAGRWWYYDAQQRLCGPISPEGMVSACFLEVLRLDTLVCGTLDDVLAAPPVHLFETLEQVMNPVRTEGRGGYQLVTGAEL